MISRILVVLGCNTHWAPYYYRYEKQFIENDVLFDVVIWDRENISETLAANTVYKFKLQDKGNNHNIFKVLKFFQFARFVKKTIVNNKYEKIIFLGWAGCAATLNSGLLKRKYKYRYLLDIRDYHYEWCYPYFLLEKMVINNSYATMISSFGFKSFLPDHHYYINHNVAADLNVVSRKFKKTKDDCVRISFIGNIRYLDENKQLLEVFANDHRFRLQYFGYGSEAIRKFCDDHKITNVEFHEKFDKEDTVLFYNKTDIINNVYGNHKTETKTALSNKLYYGIYLKLPILVSSNTYMEDIVNRYRIGLAFECDKKFPDVLYDWYRSKENKINLERNYATLLSMVISDQKKADELLLEFCESK